MKNKVWHLLGLTVALLASINFLISVVPAFINDDANANINYSYT